MKLQTSPKSELTKIFQEYLDNLNTSETLDKSTVLDDLPISLWLETAAKAKKVFAPGAVRWYAPHMPNQPAADQTQIAIRMPRTLRKRLERLAVQRGDSLAELVRTLLERGVKNVQLTPEDYKEIARQTKEAENKK